MSGAPMSDAERAAVLDAYDREIKRPLPNDWSSVARVVGGILLVATLIAGRIARWLHVPFLPVLLVLGIGACIAFLFGMMNFAESAASSRAEAAIVKLGSGFATMSEEEKRTATVSLIVNAFFSGGPYTRETIDIKQVRGRLGASLPYVEAVEEVLAAEKKAYHVVTLYAEGNTAQKES
jgi:hypothetical protein